MDGGQGNNIKQTETQSVPACECKASVDLVTWLVKQNSFCKVTMQAKFKMKRFYFSIINADLFKHSKCKIIRLKREHTGTISVTGPY